MYENIISNKLKLLVIVIKINEISSIYYKYDAV